MQLLDAKLSLISLNVTMNRQIFVLFTKDSLEVASTDVCREYFYLSPYYYDFWLTGTIKNA